MARCVCALLKQGEDRLLRYAQCSRTATVLVGGKFPLCYQHTGVLIGAGDLQLIDAVHISLPLRQHGWLTIEAEQISPGYPEYTKEGLPDGTETD